ncbi:TetR/AcrR family transcriptional regulator [Salinibacterium sp. M195]|uniref:TetR/AcrR family transcriptional regulator n=1 Tax=Salinibacterium sp. M195 TaxID=2583374 RepID=UPI001C634FE1|nr:TetR/AcrR family transcriptional regulator [Salinibacterium sp. M195]QYH36603.1 TetR/AcrR family transcriptional regulator [Salinibacterium sp. M195]
MRHKPEAIIDAAILLFDRDGIGISTAKVAAAAGVSNGTLFNYFSSKQILLDAVYLQLTDELAAALGEFAHDAAPREQFFAAWRRWLEWAKGSPEHHRVKLLLKGAALVSPQAQQVADAHFGALYNLLAECSRANLFVDLPNEYLAETFIRQLELSVDSALTPEQGDRAFAVLWNGITLPASQATHARN